MKLYVGITDYEWFKILKRENCDEINFWKPGGRAGFKALNPGDMFLFKLHSPKDYIAGGGFFLKFSILPSSLAWDAFGISNGAISFDALRSRIHKYKRTDHFSDPDPNIGCIILSMPFYFEEQEWIPVPQDWSQNIVQGKTYDTSTFTGMSLYKQVLERINKKNSIFTGIREQVPQNRYGSEQIIRPRIGQGAFKVLITDAYHRRCAITGEKTLPVLEAAHIKPYSQNGPHEISNGLLLRKDFHALFDRGYLTIDKNLNVEVSHRIKEDFGNGKEYYAHHGSKLIILPEQKEHLPDTYFLEWHNENVYLG